MKKELVDFLRKLKQFGLENNVPNVSETGGRFLHMLVKMTGAKNILEIGCANGYSTIWLAEAANANNGRVVSIDFSKPTFEAAKENLMSVNLSDSVDFHFGNALEIISDIKTPQKFDFIFVDGEKRSYWDFWRAVRNRLTDKAVIVFDDVLSFPDKTEDFMKKVKDVIGFDQVVLPIDKHDGILLMFKSN